MNFIFAIQNMNFGNFGNTPSTPAPTVAPTGGLAPLNLSKGQVLDLTKQAPSLKNCILGAGWDVAENGSTFDLDISAFLLDANGRVANPATDVVYFGKQDQMGIRLEGDNLTGAGEGDDERIDVDLNNISPSVQSIVFNVNIYDAMVKRQTFGMVQNSYVRLLDADNNERELCRYELKDSAASATAVIFAKLVRNASGWSFEAIGESCVAQDLNALLAKYLNY